MSKVSICGINTSSLPRLTENETLELIDLAKNGNEIARDKFIVANLRLVLSVIKRFRIKDVNVDDVFQAGVIGLIKSLDNFDKSYGVKFSTYAVPMIVGEIKRILRENNSMRISRSIRDTAYRALKTRAELEKDQDEVSIETVANYMNESYKEVVYALDAISDTLSLFDPVFNKEGDTLLLMDQIGDEKNTDENLTEKFALDHAMSLLPDREKKIIFLRYYEGKTQTEISEEIGISQAQVSRLEKTALSEIKAKIRA